MSLHALPQPHENITHEFVAHCKALTRVGNRWSKLFQVDPRPFKTRVSFRWKQIFFWWSTKYIVQLVTSPTMDFVDRQTHDLFNWKLVQTLKCLGVSFEQASTNKLRHGSYNALEWATNLCMQFSLAWSRACKHVNLFELHKPIFLSLILRPKCNCSGCFQYHKERQRVASCKQITFPNSYLKLVIG